MLSNPEDAKVSQDDVLDATFAVTDDKHLLFLSSLTAINIIKQFDIVLLWCHAASWERLD